MAAPGVFEHRSRWTPHQAPSFSLNTKSWHETCRTAHFSVRPRRSHFSVPTAVRLRRRVERPSRMAAAWRPPEGLVLDGREHGGRLCHAGGRRSSPQGTSCSTSHVPYSVWEAEAGRPSKTVLSASSESVILLTGHQDLASATHDREGWQGMSALLGYRGLDRKRAQF